VAPLEGILVLDFTRAVAGPFCTMMLGDLGARVIKIEEEQAGDETRQWGPPFLDGESTYFLSMNRNKESVAANLKSEEGRRLVHSIGAHADVVIENFRPGVADRLGIGHAAFHSRAVYTSISGFGQASEKAGYDLILQAMSGSIYLSEAKVAFPVADILAGLFASNAILAALYARNKTGRGRFIDISLFDGMLCAMSNLAAGTLNTGAEPRRVGIAQPNIVPYQLFHCRDAPIVLGAPNERLWTKVCEALERPEWLTDPRFQGNAKRNEHRAELVPLIEAVLLQDSAAAWIEKLEAREVPCGPVSTLTQALTQAPVVQSEHGKLGKIRLVGNPMHMNDFSPTYRASRALGEDTARIRAEFLEQS